MGPIASARTRRKTRRLGVESLESRTVLTAIVDVNLSGHPVEALDIIFSEALNIDPAAVSPAFSLRSLENGPVDVTSSFVYHEETRTLTWSLGSSLGRGTYEMRIDGAQLTDAGGVALQGGAGGLEYSLPVFATASDVTAGIDVGGFTVPSLADWNSDGVLDLIVGEKTASGEGKIRAYLNSGTSSEPMYDAYTYAQQEGHDLILAAQGCLGVFPRVFDWDGDGRQDLLLGTADGYIQVLANVGTDTDPQFAAAENVQWGESGSKVDVHVGARATFDVVDWNNDGRFDLVVGGFDGKVRVYVNTNESGPADFQEEAFVYDGTTELAVPSNRSSVAVFDLDGDSRKDLLLGNTEGQLLYYRNVGTDAQPKFDGMTMVEADGLAIDLPGIPRSRPYVGDFNADELPDLLVGAQDGLVRLYQGLSWSTLTTVDPYRQGAAGETFSYTFWNSAGDWRNPVNAYDVNDDGTVSPLDALLVINELNSSKYGDLWGRLPETSDAGRPPAFLDVNQDGYCSPVDALTVISQLGSGAGAAEAAVVEGLPGIATFIGAEIVSSKGIRDEPTQQVLPPGSATTAHEPFFIEGARPTPRDNAAAADHDAETHNAADAVMSELAMGLAPFWATL